MEINRNRLAAEGLGLALLLVGLYLGSLTFIGLGAVIIGTIEYAAHKNKDEKL